MIGVSKTFGGSSILSSPETSNHYDYWFFVIYANNEPNPVLARDLGDCRAKDVEEMNGHFLMFNKNIISINANPFLHRKNQQQNV